MGAIAGGIGSISFLGETIGACGMIAPTMIGRAGSDAIEQLAETKLPSARLV